MRLRDAPIKKKLMLVILATSCTALLLTAVGFITYERFTFKQNLAANTASLAKVVAANSTAALIYQDQKDAKEILSSLRAERQVVAAALYTKDGKRFAQYVAPGRTFPVPDELKQVFPYRFESDYLVMVQRAVQEGQSAGLLLIVSDFQSLNERVTSYVSIVLIVLLSSFLAAILVSSLLQKSISEPILALARTSKLISERKDYSLRVNKVSEDEIGSLTDAFNDMLVQISRRDAALIEGAERLRLALQASQTGIWEWDLQANRISWDKFVYPLFALEPGQFGGTFEDFLALIHPEDRQLASRVVHRAIETRREFIIEFRVTWPDGTVHHLGSRGKAVYDASHRPVRMTGVVMDMTQSKHAEEEIRRLNSELEQRVVERTAELAATNKELEAFTYSVSHDLRAPLRHIDAYAKILADEFSGNLPPAAQNYLNRICYGTQSMGHLVDDLLNLGRVGRQEMNKEPCDLTSIASEVIEGIADDLGDRQIEWRLGKLPTLPCDRGLIRQVFANLIANAVKYTRTRDRAVIEIGPVPGAEERTIFIRDNGVGFSMKYAHKLFGVFQRLHRSDEFEGTGVGLAIVERIIRKHGGRVWAEAEVDHGATFYFTLGVSEAGSSAKEPTRSPTNPA